MAKPRVGTRLSDLNLPGKPVQIKGTSYDVPGGREVVLDLYVRKLSPDEHDTCVRKGSAARARVTARQRDPESDEHLELIDKLDQWSRKTMEAMLVVEHKRTQSRVVEAMLLGEEDSEWAKDDYLRSLRDDWLDDPDGTPGLNRAYAADPDDPEASRVLAELKRFEEAHSNRLRIIGERFESELAMESDEAIAERLREQMAREEQQAAWILEYQAWQVALGTRLHDPSIPDDKPHPEHKERYFESRQEVAETDEDIINQLLEAFDEITVDVEAGKDSQPAPTSSPPSEPPAESEAAGVLPSSHRVAI